MTTPIEVWHAGERVDLDAAGWARRVPAFMGCGFRVAVPSPAALTWAQTDAARVAALFARPLDDAAWASVEAQDGPVVVEGGWEYWPGRPMGEPWTGVAAIEPTGPADVPVAAVRLPWTWATETPTAGLPMLSDAADRQARRHLDRVGADVGLWLDHRGALCASTAGAVLVRAADGAWLRPDDASAPPSSWAYEQACEAVAARRTTLDGAVLASASIIRVVDELGGLLRIV